MYLVLFVLCSLPVILFIIYYKFKTLKRIFNKFFSKFKVAQKTSKSVREVKTKVAKPEKAKKKSVKETKNQAQNKSPKKEPKEKPKKEAKAKNKEQKPDKASEVVSPPDKGVKVTTDKKLKTLPLPQGTKKDKPVKNKSNDSGGDWITVQKRVKKPPRTAEGTSITLTSAPNKGFKSSESAGKLSDVKVASKPFYKEPAKTVPIINAGKTSTVNKTVSDSTLAPKPVAAPKNEPISIIKNDLVTKPSGAPKKTSNELAQGFFFIKGNKADNDSKQYLDFANQNKRKFQTDYAKTVYKPNAWAEKTNGFGDISKSLDFKSESPKSSVESTFSLPSESNVGTQISPNQVQNSTSFVELTEPSSQVISSALNFSAPSPAGIETTEYLTTPNQVSNQTFASNTSVDFPQNFGTYGGSVMYSYAAQTQPGPQGTVPLSTQFASRGAEVFSYGSYSEDFPVLYNSTGPFIEMPPNNLTNFTGNDNKSYFAGNAYPADGAPVALAPENFGTNFDQIDGTALPSAVPYGVTSGQFVSGEVPFYTSDINVDKRNYGLSDESEVADKLDVDSKEEAGFLNYGATPIKNESLNEESSTLYEAEYRQPDWRSSVENLAENPEESYFAEAEDSQAEEHETEEASSEAEGSEPECERSLSTNEEEQSGNVEDSEEKDNEEEQSGNVEDSEEKDNEVDEGVSSAEDQEPEKSEDQSVEDASEDEIEDRRPSTEEEIIDSEESGEEIADAGVNKHENAAEELPRSGNEEGSDEGSDEERNKSAHQDEDEVQNQEPEDEKEGSDKAESANTHSVEVENEQVYVGSETESVKGKNSEENEGANLEVESSSSSTISSPEAVRFNDNYFELQSNEDVSKILGKDSDQATVSARQESNNADNESVDQSSSVDEDKLIVELSDALKDESEATGETETGFSESVSVGMEMHEIEARRIEEELQAKLQAIPEEPPAQEQNSIDPPLNSETEEDSRPNCDLKTEPTTETDKVVKEGFPAEVSETLNETKKDRFKSVGRSKARPQKMVSTSIRVLTLNDGEHQDSTLYRLERDWILEFRLGPSLFGRKVKIFVNFPEKGQEFHRDEYRSLSLSNSSSHDDCAKFCQIQLHTSGSFHYYFTFENDDSKKGSGYFLVDPVLTAGNDVLPLDCIQSVTYLSKLLGPFSTWENKLRVAKESGYNMIHFTPVQELGGSNSAYSLKNQLTLNVTFNEGNRVITYDDVAKLTDKLRNEWKVLSICDIVLNHTANESPWLQEHPECTYNLVNSPHLKPAYLLDITLDNLSKEISEGKWEFSGIPNVVNSEEHLSAIKHALFGTILPKVKIVELFTMDIDKLVVEFQTQSRNRVPPSPTEKATLAPLKLIPDPEFRRLAAKVDMDQALALFNVYRSDCFDEETRLKRCSEEFKKCLQKLNDDVFNKVQSDLGAAVENFVAGVRYFRVQHDGPRLTEVTEKDPLSPRYFTDPPNGASEEVLYSPEGRFVMAHNGWVMNADPLQNFAAPGSDVYLRRELIAWGDSVKLRYGEKPADCPYLWNLMKDYVERTVKTFDGIRLDNCHSTPIVVAQYLLDVGRRIKPNLYVAAELFTNSDGTDNIFVNKLGITSLIREAMSAWDSHEEGRLVYRYGGVPVGAFVQPTSRPLVPSVAHALFLDLTHDNPSPVEKRTVFDLLPSAALVSMACCASGSNMGYDLLVPHHIHVVDESRMYLEWGNNVNLSTGIIGGKRALNNLHYILGKEGYSQVFVDQVDTDIVCVTRHNEITHETVILVAYTAFHPPSSVASGIGKGVTVSGHGESVILEATLSHKGGQKYAPSTQFKRDPKVINGLDEYTLDLKEDIDLKESRMLDFVYFPDGSTRVNFTSQFKPGSVVAVKFTPHPKVLPALQKLSTKQDLSHVISQLSLVDLNKALYCCAEEEGGCYDVPNFGRLVYAGLQGIVSPLSTIAPNNDLGHPICGNLRDGHWMMDYISSRLKNHPGTKQLGDCLEQLFAPLKDIPRFLVPSYFNLIIMQVYEDLLNQVWSQMSELVSSGSAFCKSLALGSVQLGGIVSSSPLPLLSSNLLPPKPAVRTNKDGRTEQLCASLSAGLPHFSHGYMRNWGRDTFIALRGLFLLTGRYQEARYIILAFGGCLRHGLIPNLLDGGNNPRYNCRDAVWWWLYTIQSYVELVPQGHTILNDVVNRIFPKDDSPNSSVDQPLREVIQEAMSVHFQGLCFRERNAGTAIDAHMVSQGFDNQIGVNPNTGFVFGGNEWNCGTWMDKMGSSEKAGTKGRPATPRDGSAVELVGLCKAAVRWLAALNEKNLYPYSGVTRTNKDGSSTTWSYADWNERIQNNFEKHFWVATSPDPNEKRPDLVNRKGIYKDTYGASQPWTDYQLRPNFPVAMVVAPELFTPSNALTALQTVESVLLGPLGIKTLDPTDWCYDGNYDNSNDSSDAKVAHGFNYHQGPEWLWPVGFFLRAKLHFSEKAKGHGALAGTIAKTLAYLSHHYSVLQSSVWRGLPELTNKDGAFCPGSCTVQAWSMSTVLEVLEDISKLESEAEFENIVDPVKL